jgi:cell wall-associated NlpC family hydrolase
VPTAVRRTLSLAVVLAFALAGVLVTSLAPVGTGVRAADAATLTFRQQAVQIAAAHKGDPYVYGAAGPHAFDCSGLTLFVYKKVGHYLPHSAQEQYSYTRHIAKSEKRPGDLIFYTSNGRASGIYHVAIYSGNGYTWVAPHSGSHVEHQKIYSSSYLVGRVRA